MLLHRKLGSGYGVEVDWWALGVVMYELLTGWPPFFDSSFDGMCEKIVSQAVPFKARHGLTQDAQDLISALLHKDRRQRMCCGAERLDELKNHFFYRVGESSASAGSSSSSGSGGGPEWFAELLRGNVMSPFKPSVGKADDVRNFDREHTRQALGEAELLQNDEPLELGQAAGEQLYPLFCFNDASVPAPGM